MIFCSNQRLSEPPNRSGLLNPPENLMGLALAIFCFQSNSLTHRTTNPRQKIKMFDQQEKSVFQTCHILHRRATFPEYSRFLEE